MGVDYQDQGSAYVIKEGNQMKVKKGMLFSVRYVTSCVFPPLHTNSQIGFRRLTVFKRRF